MTDIARLTALPVALRDAGWSHLPPYRCLRECAIEGRFPAHQRNSFWHFDRSDTARIAAALGLVRESQDRAAA